MKKNLIVDDENTVCKSINKILSRKGYIVENSYSAEEAIRKIKKTSYDLVITDIKMPEMNGLELLEIVKEYYPDLSVVLITGYPSVDTAKRAFKLGAADYLSKPFTSNELTKTAERALNKIKTNEKFYTLLEEDINDKNAGKVLSGIIDDDLQSVSEIPSILDTKTKALISIAISICAQRQWCIGFYVKKAFENGATRKEILYAASMAFSIVGEPGPMYIIPLREALDLFDTQCDFG